MATVTLVESATIDSGDWGNVDTPSCCYIPGAAHFGSAYFGCNAKIRVACTDEGDVYIALNGGSCGHNKRQLAKGSSPWTENWGVSAKSFTISSVDDLPNGKWELGNMTVDPDPSGNGGYAVESNAIFNFPSAPSLSVGDTYIPTSGKYDFGYVGNVKNLEGDHSTYFYIYVAFPVKNKSGEFNFATVNATRILISGSWVPKIFSYYPWGRWIDGQVWSHNRSGGRLSRYNGGWNDVKNWESDPSSSQGFRFDGNDWAVSPRTGREE